MVKGLSKEKKKQKRLIKDAIKNESNNKQIEFKNKIIKFKNKLDSFSYKMDIALMLLKK